MDTTLLDKWFQDLHQSELFVNMTFISSRIIWEAVGTVTLKNHRVHTSKCHSVVMESKYWRLHTKHFKRCWMKHTTECVTMIFRLLYRQNLFLRRFPACVLSANCRFFWCSLQNLSIYSIRANELRAAALSDRARPGCSWLSFKPEKKWIEMKWRY